MPKSHRIPFKTHIRELNLLSSFNILEYTDTYWGQFRVEFYKVTISSYSL